MTDEIITPEGEEAVVAPEMEAPATEEIPAEAEDAIEETTPEAVA
ncbi:MAG: hypothetical protein NT068_02925 [Candidatus Nomurabacteria bacterium]|nr:hypothetical protein [Candidatus Nomurabacteria bacterium]